MCSARNQHKDPHVNENAKAFHFHSDKRQMCNELFVFEIDKLEINKTRSAAPVHFHPIQLLKSVSFQQRRVMLQN